MESIKSMFIGKAWPPLPHAIVQHHNEMDLANTGECIRSAGAIEESISTASKGSFSCGELVYNEA